MRRWAGGVAAAWGGAGGVEAEMVKLKRPRERSELSVAPGTGSYSKCVRRGRLSVTQGAAQPAGADGHIGAPGEGNRHEKQKHGFCSVRSGMEEENGEA